VPLDIYHRRDHAIPFEPARSNLGGSNAATSPRQTPRQYMHSMSGPSRAVFASEHMPPQPLRFHSSLPRPAVSSTVHPNEQSAYSYPVPLHSQHAHGPSPNPPMSIEVAMHLQRNSQHYHTRTTRQLYVLHGGRKLPRRSPQMQWAWYVEDLERSDRELAMTGERWVYY
jgi:hypothetical protein